MDQPIDTLSFEAALKELEQIVGRLESGDTPLDEAITLYERGSALRAHCAARLDAAQASVLMAFSAVPTASSAYVLAQRMGYNGAFVAGLVTMSTVLGVVSLPFALALPR